MSNRADEILTILEIGKNDLNYHVCESVWALFNNYVSAYCDEFKSYDLSKEQKLAKQRKAFQLKLRDIYLKDDHSAYTDFYDDMKARMRYLGELVQQLVHLHIKIFSKIRPRGIDTLDVPPVDERDFTNKILNLNCFTFFHNVPLYYSAYACRNKSKIKEVIDSNCNDILSKLAASAYDDLFKRESKKTEVETEEELLDNIIEKTRGRLERSETSAKSPRRVISPPRETRDMEKDTSPQYKEIDLEDKMDVNLEAPTSVPTDTEVITWPQTPPPASPRTKSPPNSPSIGGEFDESILPPLPPQPALRRQTNGDSDDDLLSRV